jgi:hypothetical protein
MAVNLETNFPISLNQQLKVCREQQPSSSMLYMFIFYVDLIVFFCS